MSNTDSRQTIASKLTTTYKMIKNSLYDLNETCGDLANVTNFLLFIPIVCIVIFSIFIFTRESENNLIKGLREKLKAINVPITTSKTTPPVTTANLTDELINKEMPSIFKNDFLEGYDDSIWIYCIYGFLILLQVIILWLGMHNCHIKGSSGEMLNMFYSLMIILILGGIVVTLYRLSTIPENFVYGRYHIIIALGAYIFTFFEYYIINRSMA